MELRIDIRDWEQEAREQEIEMRTKEQAIQARIENQLHPAQAARLYIIARELGLADSEMLASNKLLLMTGGAAAWSRMEANEYQRVKLKNGREIKVRRLVHAVSEEQPSDDGDEIQLDMALDAGQKPSEPPDDDPAPVFYDDPAATDRAIRYIMSKIPGYLMGRFHIIAANEGDVFSVWNDFVDQMEGKIAGLV